MSKSSGIFADLASSWPSSFVSRSEIGRFSGGAINPRTLANQDSLGTGPKNRIHVGKKVIYKVSDIIEWLESRVKVAEEGSA